MNEEDGIVVKCEVCGDTWFFENCEVWVEPWPHVVCPHCHNWIPLF